MDSLNFLYMAAAVYLFSILNDLGSEGTHAVHVGKEHYHIFYPLQLGGDACAKNFSHYFKISEVSLVP